MALQLVLKLSKLCNLRCRYCYEFPFLSDTERMSPEVAQAVAARTSDFVGRGGSAQIILHGGEPLILPIEYLARIMNVQAATLAGAGGSVRYSLQSNLYRLSEAHVDFVKRWKIRVGVSYDYVGTERVTRRGGPTQEAVLSHAQRLQADGVGVGAVCVVGRHNAGSLPKALSFFQKYRFNVRLSPIHKDGFEAQNDLNRLSAVELQTALIEAFAVYWRAPMSIAVEPLRRVIRNCAAYLGLATAPARPYRNYPEPRLIVIGMDGGMFSHRDDPSTTAPQGNVLDTPFEQRHLSARGGSTVAEVARLQGETCGKCPYFGACDGRFVAEATGPEVAAASGERGCLFRPLHDHVIAVIANDAAAPAKLLALGIR